MFSILKSITAKLFLTFGLLTFGQQSFAQFFDDFTDNDFVNGPKWFGTDSNFTVDSARLQLKAPPLTDIAYLVTPSSSINAATWEFLIRLDFNPSSSNFTRIYVVSNASNLSGPIQGYFVELGNTSDDVSLYVQSGTTIKKIIDGLDGILDKSVVVIRIKVTRDRDGTWELYTDPDDKSEFASEGQVKDQQHLTSSFFGILCGYTSSRSDKFYFDDIAVTAEEIPADSPPVVSKDLVFTEIFADPSPPVNLPEMEYVEIFNRRQDPISLKGWSLSDASSSSIFPDVILLPAQYIIVTSNPARFPIEIQSVGISNFPSLNNSEDVLTLKDENGQTIDSLHYTSDWYRTDQKKEGGWSIELIDPDNLCAMAENWTASEHPNGGTPGSQNSVFAYKPDLTAPKLVSAIPVSPNQMLITFNEKMQSDVPATFNFVLEPFIGVTMVSFADITKTELLIDLADEIVGGFLYGLTVSSITDCAGNQIDPNADRVAFGLPETALSSDVVINEVLFDPFPLGVDFVEIVNVSNKFFNVRNWSIGNLADDTISNVMVISMKDLLLPPGGYLALTEDKEVLVASYSSVSEQNILQVTDLPSMNDDEGSIAVATNSVMLDHFNYSSSLHSVFLKDPEGVSLERISFDLPTSDFRNWKSASSASGYATPGNVNSNASINLTRMTGNIRVEPEVFVPVYGQPDFIQVHYQFDHGGFIANVKVIDAQGHLIKHLVKGEILGTEGAYRWDGDRDDGTKAGVGYYAIWFEVFDDSGEVKTFLSRVAVATRF